MTTQTLLDQEELSLASYATLSSAPTPGMAVSAEISTGKRRVIEFLLDPVRKTASEGLRER